jgi:hypothetical protein
MFADLEHRDLRTYEIPKDLIVSYEEFVVLENTYGIYHAQVGFIPSEVYEKYVSSLATSAYTSEDNLGNLC